MKSIYGLILIITLGYSCSINNEDIKHLSGYWRIVEAESPNGEKRKYEVNSNIDFFKLKENKGIRKKLKIQLNEQFSGSNDYLSFEIDILKSGTFIIYSKQNHTWKEEILSLIHI